MEHAIKSIFNNEIARAGADKFGVRLEQLTFLGAWQNFIYEYWENEKCYILRFTPSTHRNEQVIQGELDWINYLFNHDVFVSTPVKSSQENWTEIIHTNDIYFTVTAFHKAEGRKIGYPECLHNTNLYESLGKIIGRMHALSKSYKPKDAVTRRNNWYDNYYLQNLRSFVPPDQIHVFEACNRLMETINHTLLPDHSSYGLIHADIGVGNFLVNDHTGVITLFDFDEAQYSWYIEDIAVPLYYLVYVYGGDEGKKERASQALRFMEYFMKGYNQEHSIDSYWLKQMPLFLRLREIIVYTGMHRSIDLQNIDQWSRDYLTESKVRIERGIPIVDVWN